MKNLLFFIFGLSNYNLFAACPAIPPAPAFPACGTLTTLPAGGDLGSGGTFGVGCGPSLTIGTNITNGSVTTKIYVLSGQSLTIDGNFSATKISIYVQTGATLNLNGNLDGGDSLYIYGTMNHSLSGTARVQSTGTTLYIASTGLYKATTLEVNNFGTIVNEGAVSITTISQFQNNALFCNNRSGCLDLGSMVTNNVPPSATTGFVTDVSPGYIIYNSASCPTPNNDFTITTALDICAPNIATTGPGHVGPCSRFGSATNIYNSSAPCNTNATCTNSIALPVSLSFFKSEYTNEGVISKWGTNDARDSDHFIVERSKNGIDWIQIGTVKTKNERGKYNEYSIIDQEHFSGGMYYRLSEVDIKGRTTNYSVDFLENIANLDFFSIYPNPSNSSFTVNVWGDHTSYNFEIVDLAGKSIAQYVLQQGQNKIEDKLPAGMYIAKLKVEKDYKIQRLDIQ